MNRVDADDPMTFRLRVAGGDSGCGGLRLDAARRGGVRYENREGNKNKNKKKPGQSEIHLNTQIPNATRQGHERISIPRGLWPSQSPGPIAIQRHMTASPHPCGGSRTAEGGEKERGRI